MMERMVLVSMKKYFLFFTSLAVLMTGMIVPANAVDVQKQINEQLNKAAEKAELKTIDKPAIPVQAIIAEMVKLLLTLVGTIFMALLVFAGYLRMTANGESERVEKSAKTMQAAVIGLALALASYGITTFVATRIQNSVQYRSAYEENNSTANSLYEGSIGVDAKDVIGWIKGLF